jgi:hypothetical protein
MIFDVNLVSVPVRATSSIEITSDSLEEAHELAVELLRGGKLSNWVIGNFPFPYPINVNVEIFVNKISGIKSYSVEYVSVPMSASISIQIESDSEEQALKQFKSTKIKDNWSWDGIPVPFASIPVDKIWLINTNRSITPTISSFTESQNFYVGFPISVETTVTYFWNNATGYADGEISINGGPKYALSGGSKIHTIIPDRAGRYIYSIEYYGYKYDDKTVAPASKEFEFSIQKGNMSVSASTPKNTIKKGSWFPITVSRSREHDVSFKVYSDGSQGVLEIGSGRLSSFSAVYLCIFNSGINWGPSQNVYVVFDGDSDYNAATSNSLSLNVS